MGSSGADYSGLNVKVFDFSEALAWFEQDRKDCRLGLRHEPVVLMVSLQRSRLVTALVALGLLSSCVNGGETDDTARDAAIYRSVVIDLVDRSRDDLELSGDPPVLFIEALGSNEIPLEVQVDVVAGFVEQYEIRFIDHRDEAIEVDLPDLPVRAQSMLVGLGDIDIDDTAEVHSEIYLSADDVRGFSYTLIGVGDGHWDVVGEPVDIEPEELVPRP